MGLGDFTPDGAPLAPDLADDRLPALELDPRPGREEAERDEPERDSPERDGADLGLELVCF